jgi:hypothetical protein
MKAVIGRGAYWNAGKEPKPLDFLTDEDFGMLTMGIIEGMGACAPHWELSQECVVSQS